MLMRCMKICKMVKITKVFHNRNSYKPINNWTILGVGKKKDWSNKSWMMEKVGWVEKWNFFFVFYEAFLTWGFKSYLCIIITQETAALPCSGVRCTHNQFIIYLVYVYGDVMWCWTMLLMHYLALFQGWPKKMHVLEHSY